MGDTVILGQEKRVVLKQQPKTTALDMKGKWFQADRPIVAYRRRRKELIRAVQLDRTVPD